MTAHTTAGACLCLVRGFQFPYITLWIPVFFDFGLHDLFAWVWIFESNNYSTKPGGNYASHFGCQSWLGFRRCLRWMTIGLTILLGPQGKCVSVCVPSFVVGTSGSVITRMPLSSHMHTHTNTQKPLSVHWCIQCYDSYNLKQTQWIVPFQNICQSLSSNTDKTIPREQDKSPCVPGAKHD